MRRFLRCPRVPTSAERSPEQSQILPPLRERAIAAPSFVPFPVCYTSFFLTMAAPPPAIICPSMLSSDFANLATEAQRMVDAGADWLHMDVMVSSWAGRAAAVHPERHARGARAAGCRVGGTAVHTTHLSTSTIARAPLHPLQDGHFVPNLTLGAPVIAALRKHTRCFLDCHLMVTHPEQWVDDFAKAGADGFTFHVEATGA